MFKVKEDACPYHDHQAEHHPKAVRCFIERHRQAHAKELADKSEREKDKRHHRERFHNLVLFSREKGVIGLAQLNQRVVEVVYRSLNALLSALEVAEIVSELGAEEARRSRLERG